MSLSTSCSWVADCKVTELTSRGTVWDLNKQPVEASEEASTAIVSIRKSRFMGYLGTASLSEQLAKYKRLAGVAAASVAIAKPFHLKSVL